MPIVLEKICREAEQRCPIPGIYTFLIHSEMQMLIPRPTCGSYSVTIAASGAFLPTEATPFKHLARVV